MCGGRLPIIARRWSSPSQFGRSVSDGNGYDARGEDARLDRRIDDQTDGCQRRVGKVEHALIDVEADLAKAKRDLGGRVLGEIGDLRTHMHRRFDESETARLEDRRLRADDRRLLERIASFFGIPVTP